MAGKENPIQSATRIFDESIYGLRDSKIAGLSEIASRTVDRIKNRDIRVVVNSPTFNIPSVTGFDLVETAPAPYPLYGSAIVVDLGKILETNSEVIKGDLARTIAVADQYPLNGFQRRYRAVYEDALRVQADYLESSNTKKLPFDPRTTDRDILVRRLLGDARYYSDVGIEDWHTAIDDYKESGEDNSATLLLDQLRDVTGHFLVMRQRYVPMNHRIVKGQIGEEYVTEWDADKRAEEMAYSLLGISIYSALPPNN